MPRSSRSSSRSKTSSFSSSKQITQQSQVPVQHNVKVEQPGFFSNMWQGFGLGAGQAIAHNIFRSDPVVQHVHTPQSPTSSQPIHDRSKLEENLPKEFVQCMKEYDNNKDLCKQYLN
jgi:hypothetical protein